jgi:hypothetical protein
MLDRERLDVVDISTPSGRHVIVEKPMEIRREAIAGMLRVQWESGVKWPSSASTASTLRPNGCMSWRSKARLAGWCWATHRFPGGARQRDGAVMENDERMHARQAFIAGGALGATPSVCCLPALADLFGPSWAIARNAFLTFAPGGVALVHMYETLPAPRV